MSSAVPAGAAPAPLWLIVPRHPQRFDGVATNDLAKARPGPTLTMPGELAGLGIDAAAKAVAVSTMTGEVFISR